MTLEATKLSVMDPCTQQPVAGPRPAPSPLIRDRLIFSAQRMESISASRTWLSLVHVYQLLNLFILSSLLFEIMSA